MDSATHYYMAAIIVVLQYQSTVVGQFGDYRCAPGKYVHFYLYYIKCEPCPVGEYNPDFSNCKFDCEWCSPNTYQNETRQTSCKDCPPGTTTVNQSHAVSENACVICPENTYLKGDPYNITRVCIPCGKTQIKGERQLQLYSRRGSTSPSQCYAHCSPGQYFDTAYGYCLPCKPGSYSDTGFHEIGGCKPCDGGCYEDAVGSTIACSKVCWEGTYSRPGSAHCTPCEPGTFTKYKRAKRCTPCRVGYFQDNSGQKTCKKCSEGTYSWVVGTNSCIACRTGYGKRGCYRIATYVGCYRDTEKRDLRDIVPIINDYMTPDICFYNCFQGGYKYSGVQHGNECYCGNVCGTYGRIEESECSSLCAGNRTLRCGGPWANSIYTYFSTRQGW